MKFYYEFSENEYYALVVVTAENEPGKIAPYKKAAETYVEIVGGETVESVLEEATPHLRTEEYAFMKVMRDITIGKQSVEKIIKEFDALENGVLLIDSSL